MTLAAVGRSGLLGALVPLFALAVHCKSSTPPPEEDAAPKKLAALEGATKVTVRDVASVAGEEHDLVVELVRDGAEIAWTAKLTERPYAFGEPSPVASVGTGDAGAACTCPVKDACACEATSGVEVQKKSGRIPAAAFDAWLAALGKATFTPAPLDDSARDERAHATVTLPSGDPVHVVREASGRAWRSGGRDLDQRSELDVAWMRLLDALGARGWVAALHPLPIVLAPKAQPDVAKADTLELDDCTGTTSVQVALERKGATFAWHGKLGPAPHLLLSAVPDRFATHRVAQCFCGVDDACACAPTVAKRSGTVPAALVDALLTDLARRGMATGTLGGFMPGADDEAHLAVTVGATVLHFTRVGVWAVNGRSLAGSGPKDDQTALEAKWTALLRALTAP